MFNELVDFAGETFNWPLFDRWICTSDLYTHRFSLIFRAIVEHDATGVVLWSAEGVMEALDYYDSVWFPVRHRTRSHSPCLY